MEVLGSDEELEEDEAALREGETSGSELEQLEENDVRFFPSSQLSVCCIVLVYHSLRLRTFSIISSKQ